jgi:hypothetical protein
MKDNFPRSTDYVLLQELVKELRRAMSDGEARRTRREEHNDGVYSIRDRVAMLDADLAALYGVPVARLREQVRKNRARFPEDFMIQLTAGEARSLGCEGSGRGRNGRRPAPWAFTSLGVVALSSVLRGERAVRASVAMMREVSGAGIVPFFKDRSAVIIRRPRSEA